MKRLVKYSAMILALVVAGCGDSHQQDTFKKNVSMPNYEVIDRDTYDAPIKTQIEIHAVVSGNITEDGLRQLLQKLYDEANSTTDFKYNGGKPTHVFIYLYTTRAHFASGMGQWIAMLNKIGEDSRIDIEVKTNLIEQLDSKPEVKNNLSESKRKEIFREIIIAERQADAEAQRMYPLPDPSKYGYSQAKASKQLEKQVEALKTLTKKYTSEVAERHRITQEQLNNVSVEGITKNWPIP